MKVPIEAREAAKQFIRMNEKFSKREVARILADNIKDFDFEALMWEALDRAANRLIASEKDPKGVRSVYSIDRRGNYANIEMTWNPCHTLAVSDGVVRQKNALTKVEKKANDRTNVINGQMSIADWLESIGRNEKLESFVKASNKKSIV